MALIDDINNLPTTVGDGNTGHLNNHQVIHAALKDHESRLGASDIVGTGSPEGRIIATVGATYTDSAATNGAIRWIKTTGTGTTGWKVEYGDTGRRNVSDALLDGWTGSIFVSRRGAEITLTGSNLRPTSTGSSPLANLPSGFRPTNSEVGIIAEDNVPRSVFAFSYSPFQVEVRGIIKAQSWGNFSMSFFTNDQWPTTLPGTPS